MIRRAPSRHCQPVEPETRRVFEGIGNGVVIGLAMWAAILWWALS